MKNSLLIILLGVLFASCASSKNDTIVSRMGETADRTLEYQQGFVDGCGSSLAGKGIMNQMHLKDLNRYNDQYQIGWDDGFKRCGN